MISPSNCLVTAAPSRRGHGCAIRQLFLRCWLVALCCTPSVLCAEVFAPSYWVWHRSTALREEEIAELQRQRVEKVFWHVATAQAVDREWRLSATIKLPPRAAGRIAIVPVVRIEPRRDVPLELAAADAFASLLQKIARQLDATEVQIDYDCPDRRRADYARFLARCRSQLVPVRLSAAVLAGWSSAPEFPQLVQGVDALMPMFYDLFPDAPAHVRSGQILPLLDAATVTRQIEAWRHCTVPWSAGLPNFSRVTVFNGDGRSRGHLREWDWDGVCFEPRLAFHSVCAPGVTIFRASDAVTMANTAVAGGEWIACRIPELSQLEAAVKAAREAGAAGFTLFRLPGERSQSGWSLQQLRVLGSADADREPVLRLRSLPSGIELVNAGLNDLAPRLSGPKGPLDRGWQLEIESSAGAVFRESSPGEFANVFGHVEPDAAEPKRVPIALAQRLTFWFANLPAGGTRQSGLLQLAPGAGVASLRWRVPGGGRFAEWQPIE